MNSSSTFRPDWASPPGKTIALLLESGRLSRAELAQRIGVQDSEVDQLLLGNKEITPALAEKLAEHIGRSADFWLTRERQYREKLDLINSGATFLSQLPLKDMIRFGWLAKKNDQREMLDECLKFFSVPDIKSWERYYRDVIESAAFRTSPSFESETGALAAWLREGERQAEAITSAPWSKELFSKRLDIMRSLTRENDPNVFIPKLVDLCRGSGVALVILRAPLGCRASGATRAIRGNRMMLLLSFRYLSNDHFWFTFFHEAGHLVLHDIKNLFVDEPVRSASLEEEEANSFAAKLLVPSAYRDEFLALSANSRDVIRFARRIGIAPGIVVGQLQHEGILRRDQLNRLKRRFTWKD